MLDFGDVVVVLGGIVLLVAGFWLVTGLGKKAPAAVLICWAASLAVYLMIVMVKIGQMPWGSR